MAMDFMGNIFAESELFCYIRCVAAAWMDTREDYRPPECRGDIRYDQRWLTPGKPVSRSRLYQPAGTKPGPQHHSPCSAASYRMPWVTMMSINSIFSSVGIQAKHHKPLRCRRLSFVSLHPYRVVSCQVRPQRQVGSTLGLLGRSRRCISWTAAQ